jgi:hypothetical protein
MTSQGRAILQVTSSRLFRASVPIFAALLVPPQLALAQFTQQGTAAPKLLRSPFTLGNREASAAV